MYRPVEQDVFLPDPAERRRILDQAQRLLADARDLMNRLDVAQVELSALIQSNQAQDVSQQVSDRSRR